MTLEEYKNILITGTPSDRARAIAEAGNDRSLTDDEFHELTAMIKGVVRPGRRKMTPDEAKLWAETRMVRVYSCYGADGTLLGKGTAAELKDKGLFGSEGTVHECYRKRGGVYKSGGVTRMEMELCQKRIRNPMKLPDQPAKVKRKHIGGVIDPSALAYDVHDLMIYNEKARKIGKPELTYGYWAEKGKPATP